MEKLLPVWGGIECTINRVGDSYYDQLEMAGHYTRAGDIEAIAGLGIAKLRYPILWERHQPTIDTLIDWSFARNELEVLARHNIEPIVSLVHHGSGPSFVNFFDGSFESGLAEYARLLSIAFPGIAYYTPVNEPLTTARFCGLYGHWYPHKKDDHSFAKILLSECRATVMAMAAIHQTNPLAKLVATDDLGKTYSTPLLNYQAEFENERRWLSYDLISGKVNEAHPMWSYLIWCGISEEELYWFLVHNCPIDIMGLNYYVTSERHLDENIKIYPVETHGGNGHHVYADVEVIRVENDQITGFATLVKEAWARFGYPIAITEVHMHCTREEQLRWFAHIYQSSKGLIQTGIHIEGVTCWAMLGAFGWDKLLKEKGGTYEPGAFKILAGELKPTALSKLIQQISSGSQFDHPVLQNVGWWASGRSIIYPSRKTIAKAECAGKSLPLLIVGAGGTLGKAFVRACIERNIAFQEATHKQLDVTNISDIEFAIKEYSPWAIVNTSGYVRVDEAETNLDRCYELNTQGIINLSTLCAEAKIGLVNFSSDLVFDGLKNGQYVESDTTDPLNVYGKSKVYAEQAIQAIYPESLIIRTSAFFGPHDKYNFAYAVLDAVQKGKSFKAAEDIVVSPTYVPDLVNYVLDILIDGEIGVRHICNDGIVTWSEFAAMICQTAGLDINLIQPVSESNLGNVARRPRNSAMRSEYGIVLPSLESALKRFVSAHGCVEKC